MALAEIMNTMVLNHPLKDLPDTAAPDFLAGIFSAEWGVDLHENLRDCMTPSDDLDFILDNAMRGLQAGNKDYFVSQVERSIPYWDAALDSCSDDADVQDALDDLLAFWDSVTAAGDWEDTMNANYVTYGHTIDGYGVQMIDSWFKDLYFGAGQLFGLISAFLFMPIGFAENMDKETAESLALLNRQIVQHIYSH